MYNTVIHRINREVKLNQRSPAVGCLDDRECVMNHRLKKKKKKALASGYKRIVLSELYGHRLVPPTGATF